MGFFLNFDLSTTVQSLYIHWPFCPYKCHFCPFVAIAGHEEFMENYHNALVKEITEFANNISIKHPIKTIFFGGGTPSTYPINLLLDMGVILNKVFDIDLNAEVTLEVNPGTVTLEKILAWKKAGINRLSIGVQSLNNKVLTSLNRHQKSEDVLSLIETANAFFDNISIDLIIGLPGISTDEWKNMINQIVKWPINHVSLYFLTVHEDTPLYFGVKLNKIVLPHEESIVDLYYWTKDQFEKEGFEHYEISNFAKANFRSRHNSVYWSGNAYKAFGLGACSFDGKIRTQNEKNLLKYIKNVNENNDITFFKEELSDYQKWLEKLMLGLRQIDGVNICEIKNFLNEKQQSNFIREIENLSQLGLLEFFDQKIKLTKKGLSVVNEIIVKLTCI